MNKFFYFEFSLFVLQLSSSASSLHRVNVKIQMALMALRDQKKNVFPIVRIFAVQHTNNVLLVLFLVFNYPKNMENGN